MTRTKPRTARGTRRGRGAASNNPLRATQTAEQDHPRGTGTTGQTGETP